MEARVQSQANPRAISCEQSTTGTDLLEYFSFHLLVSFH